MTGELLVLVALDSRLHDRPRRVGVNARHLFWFFGEGGHGLVGKRTAEI